MAETRVKVIGTPGEFVGGVAEAVNVLVGGAERYRQVRQGEVVEAVDDRLLPDGRANPESRLQRQLSLQFVKLAEPEKAGAKPG